VAPYGKNALDGLLQAKEEINKNGGIKGKEIKLIIEDDGSSTKEAVAAFYKIISNKSIALIIGPIGSTQAMACAPIANENRIIEFSPAAATPLYTYSGDYTFRNRASAALEVERMANIAYDYLSLRRIAILYINNDVGTSFYPIFEKTFASLGGKIILTESFEQGSVDMRNQLLKIKEISPDGLYFIGHVKESGYILKQIRELNIKTRLISHYALEGSDLFTIAGNAANGVIYTAPGMEKESENALFITFEENFKKKYGKSSDVFAATAYDALYILKQAIENGEYTAESIKNQLYKIKNYKGVTGITSFDLNGDVTKPVVVKEIKNGKFVLIENLETLK
jgi:branched-chain amino acid transport system substrate-binding protein